MAFPSLPADGDPAALDDPRLTALGLLVEVTTGLERRLGDQLAEHELTVSEFEVLLRLGRSPAGQLRMNDLARQIGLSSSGLTRLADRLEGRGLLERRPCPDDGRGSFALLSPSGRELMLTVLPGHVALIDQWFTGVLGDDDLDALSCALRRVRSVVHPDAALGAEDPPADPAA